MNQLFTKLMTRIRRGFSLVEVLVAVMVLALGLLGLGAVFPAVLRQQRTATETTLGLSAQNAIAPILANGPNFKPGGRGWDALRQYVDNNDDVPGDWVSVIPEDKKTKHLGSYILPPAPLPWDSNPDDVHLPLSQRLYPLPYSTGTEPRFVWDFTARLTGDPSSADYPFDSPLLVAVFLRPIDPGIRTETHIQDGVAVADSLTRAFLDNRLSNRARRNPISVDPAGRPVLDGRRGGRGRYAMPIVITVDDGSGVEPYLDVFLFDSMVSSGTKKEIAKNLLAVPGQQFLDRQGDLYTVQSVLRPNSDNLFVTFDPPFPDPDNDGNYELLDINPIMFLPLSSPVAPEVFIINP